MALLNVAQRHVAGLGWRLLRLSRAGGGHAVGILSVWVWWDTFIHHWQPLEAPQPGAMARYRRAVYRGRPAVLQDGTSVNHGDPILEIHLDSQQVTDLGTSGHTPWQRLAASKADMRALAEQVGSGALGPVVALHGETLVEGVPRLFGFEVTPLPRTWRWALFRYFMIGEEAVYHPTGLARLNRPRERRWPVECWLSKDALLRQYGARPRRGGQDRSADGEG